MDRARAARFPGTGWVSELYRISGRSGFEIASGELALDRVRRGVWRIGEVQVLQELDDPHGTELCRLGARPRLLMSLESPLVAFRSFDRLRRSVAPVQHVMGPEFLLNNRLAPRGAIAHRLRFPSYWSDGDAAMEIAPRSASVVLVAANKHFHETPIRGWRDLRGSLRRMRRFFRRRLSSTYRALGARQLNIQELQTIVRLGLPVKMVVIDNACHGMVRQFQESYFKGRYHSTMWGYSAPDFAKVSAAYGVPSATVEAPAGVEKALASCFADPSAPFLLVVKVHPMANAYPKLAFGRPISQMEPLVKSIEMEGT